MRDHGVAVRTPHRVEHERGRLHGPHDLPRTVELAHRLRARAGDEVGAGRGLVHAAEASVRRRQLALGVPRVHGEARELDARAEVELHDLAGGVDGHHERALGRHVEAEHAAARDVLGRPHALGVVPGRAALARHAVDGAVRVVDEVAVDIRAVDVAAAALLPVDVPARPDAHHAVRARHEHVARAVAGHGEHLRRSDGAELLAGAEDLHGASARAVERGAQLGELGGRGIGSQVPEVDLLAFARGGERLRLGERALSAHGLPRMSLAQALPGGADGLQLGWRRRSAGGARHERGGTEQRTDGRQAFHYNSFQGGCR